MPLVKMNTERNEKEADEKFIQAVDNTLHGDDPDVYSADAVCGGITREKIRDALKVMRSVLWHYG